MRMRLVVMVALMSGSTGAQVVPPGTYARGMDLQATLEQQPPAPMVTAPIENTDRTRVNLIHRTQPRNAIVHATGWEVHHITGGSATMVTGGRLQRSVDATGSNVATIIDGEQRHVAPGDVIVIPPGTPHWYSDIDGSVTYLEVRYDPGDARGLAP